MRWLFAFAGLLSSAALAESQLDSSPLEPLSTPYLLKLTGGLLLVVVAILVLAWLIKRFNLNQQSQNGLIRIIAGLSIGTRDRIVLLQIGDEQILVGLTAGRIEKLHTMAHPLEAPEGQPATSAFAVKLKRAMDDKEST